MSTDEAVNVVNDTPGTLPGLLPHHLAELRASGLSDETIIAARIRSESNHTRIAGILNRRRWPRSYGPVIVYPFFDETESVVLQRAKPDNPPMRRGKPTKYLSPVGASVRVYIPRGVHRFAANREQELIVTEGEKKCLKSTQEGFPAIGLTGVEGWHRRRSTALLADLDRFEWRGRNVYIVFDSDAADNTNVSDNESLLAAALKTRGANVKAVRMPPGPGGEKVGLDDYLVANDLCSFRSLLDQAEEPDPRDAGNMKVKASELDPATEVKSILESITTDGVPRLRFWRGAFHQWKSGGYREIRNAEIRAVMIKQLNREWTKLTSGIVNNVIDQLKAQSLSPFSVEPPAWLGSPPVQWNPGDILSTGSGLVHLPSFIANEDYHLA